MRILLVILLVASTFFSSLKAQSPGGVSATLNLWLKADSGPEKGVGVPAGNGDAPFVEINKMATTSIK